MELKEKLEKECSLTKSYKESSCKIAYEYGYVTTGLQHRINELEKAIKEISKKIEL